MATAAKIQNLENITRVPPQNLEAEQALLGAILIDHDSINNVLDIIRPDDFYRDAHKKIFNSIIDLSEKNEPTDFLTVSEDLRQKGYLDQIGGASYLSSLADAMPSSANIASYARIVREKAILRKLLEVSTDISNKAFDASGEAGEILDEAEKLIFDISDNKVKSSFSKVKDVVKDSFKKIEELFESQSPVTGLETHFKDFDQMTCGLQPSDLIIVAARPSMGKTALALNIAENTAIKENANVAIFSLEMSKEQLVMRMLCSQARIDSSALRKGQLAEQDWPKLTKAAAALSEIGMYIDDTPSPTVMDMRAKVRRLKKDKGVDLVIVDYLQLVRGFSKTQSREQEISEISRALKALAKEMNIPVVALSQLNRAVENRTNRRPMLSDLRESGAIEQDADLICFIYRDEVYDPNTPDKGIAELIVGKQRNGPTGVCRLAFLNKHTRFEDLAFEANEAFGPVDDDPSPF